MRELDFADYNDKLSKSGREALALAIDESRRRDQNYLAAEHLFLAISRLERKLFEDLSHDLRLEPKDIIKDIKQHLDLSKQYVGNGLKITFSLKSIFRLAWINCFQTGRSKIEASDLLIAIFQEENNIPVEVFQLRRVEPEKVVAGIIKYVSSRPSTSALKRKFDLPRELKRLTTNLNRYARRNKTAATPGREDEINAIINLLSEKDHFRPILLSDETGLGGILVAENLARHLELEDNLLPDNLRDCQLLEFHMDHLLRADGFSTLFEFVISQLQDRKDLILFIPGLEFLLEKRPDVPATDFDRLKSALISNTIRIIWSTSRRDVLQLVEADKPFAGVFQVIDVVAPSEMEAAGIAEREKGRKSSLLGRWGASELSEQSKQAVRDAVASNDFERAFMLLSEHYGEIEKADPPTKTTKHPFSKALLVPAVILLLMLLAFLFASLLSFR